VAIGVDSVISTMPVNVSARTVDVSAGERHSERSLEVTVQTERSAGVGLLDEAIVEALAAAVRGPVILPGDASYDDMRAIQNGLIDRRPAAIVQCLGAADVVAVVNLARENNLLLSVRGGGHNVAGNSICDDGLVVDLSLMRGVQVNVAERRAYVQGGATWADVDHETQLAGLATPGGAVSTTGVAGLTLHGGMGHLRRKYGLSLDNLVSVDIVTADGQLRHASESENADLFWAVRGAGSNFGVVTSFEFKLHPVGPIVALSAVLYDIDDAVDILPRWQAFMEHAPDEISSICLFWSVPEGFPEELVGRPVFIVAGVHSGPAEKGQLAMQPLREMATPLLDMSHNEPYTAIQSSFDPFFPKGLYYYWKSTYLDTLDSATIDKLCSIAARRPSSMSDIAIWHQGGAMTSVDDAATAFGSRSATYMLSFESSWADRVNDEENIRWSREACASMQQHSTGGLYLNFAGFGEEKEALLRAVYGPSYERLVDLKTKYDPTNLFHMNQNIKPHAG